MGIIVFFHKTFIRNEYKSKKEYDSIMRLKKQEGREILKKLKMTTIYMIVSAIFLTSCVFYYGGRFIYYYSVSKGKIVQTSSNLNEILTQPVNTLFPSLSFAPSFFA